MAILKYRCCECGEYVKPFAFSRHYNTCKVCLAARETLKAVPVAPTALPGTPTLPRVNCAICNKPVDEVLVFEDEREHATYIRVRCHGDTDEMRIDRMTLATMSADQIKQMNEGEGLAFTTKKIEGAKDE